MMLCRALVLNTFPSRERCEEIAATMAQGYSYHDWELSYDLPEEINVGLADQLKAHLRDAGDEAVFMVVWMTND